MSVRVCGLVGFAARAGRSVLAISLGSARARAIERGTAPAAPLLSWFT